MPVKNILLHRQGTAAPASAPDANLSVPALWYKNWQRRDSNQRARACWAPGFI